MTVFTLPDGQSAFGLPWEMMYTLFDPSNVSQGGVWWRTKSGEVDNFNAQLVVIPELELGVIALSNLPVAGKAATVIASIYASAALEVVKVSVR